MKIFKISRLKKEAFIYLVGIVCSRAIGIMVLPYVTKILEPSQYGLWGIFGALLAFVRPFSGAAMTFRFNRQFYGSDHNSKKDLIGEIVLILVISAGLIWVPTLLISGLYKFDGFETYCLALIPIILFAQNIKEFTFKVMRFEGRPILCAILDFTAEFINTFILVFLLMFISKNWPSIVYADFLSKCIFCMIGLTYLQKKYSILKSNVRKNEILSSLKYGLPLMPYMVGASAILIIDRVIVHQMLSLNAVGVYTLAYTLAGGVRIILMAINQAWGPWVQKNLKINSLYYKHVLQVVVRKLVVFTALISIFVYILSFGFINYFTDALYSDAILIIPWAIAAFAFEGMHNLLSHQIYFIGKTTFLMRVTILNALINIGISICLTMQIGLIGAAIATAISQCFQFLMTYYYLNKKQSEIISFNHGLVE